MTIACAAGLGCWWLFCGLGVGLVSWLSNLVVCGFDSACLVCFRILNLLASLLRFWFRSLFCVSCWVLVMLWFVPLRSLLWFAWWLCVLLLQPWLGFGIGWILFCCLAA